MDKREIKPYPKPEPRIKKKTCKGCREKFIPKGFNQKYCMEKDSCIREFIESKKKHELKAWNKEKKQRTIDLMSVDEYRAKYVQPIINEIARLIDYGQPCIATGNTQGKMNGGHLISVGSNRSLALNLHNVHLQSYHSNKWKGGDETNYREGIKRVYGIEYYERLQRLKQTDLIKLSKDDLKEIKRIASEIRKELKSNPKARTPKERIELRDSINAQIGIY